MGTIVSEIINLIFIIIFIVLGIIAIFKKDIISFLLCLLFGIFSLYIHNDIIHSKPKFKPEYQIELLNQDDITISNGTDHDTISFEYLEEYIEHDNL